MKLAPKSISGVIHKNFDNQKTSWQIPVVVDTMLADHIVPIVCRSGLRTCLVRRSEQSPCSIRTLRLIEQEKRPVNPIVCLTVSENLQARLSLEALGSTFLINVQWGTPSARYYGGNENNIDQVELFCQKRATLKLSTWTPRRVEEC
jgi:hypothetical protein